MAIPTCRSINSRSLFLPELVFKIPRGPSKRRRNPKFFYGMAELNLTVSYGVPPLLPPVATVSIPAFNLVSVPLLA
ncbi:hypothetical protein SDJN03_26375, partial [Cucurbita argyrosperma subsp. sororia]